MNKHSTFIFWVFLVFSCLIRLPVHAQWEGAVFTNLSQSTQNDRVQSKQALALSGQGGLHAVWLSNSQLQYAYRPPGEHWGPAVLLYPELEILGYPVVAASPVDDRAGVAFAFKGTSAGPPGLRLVFFENGQFAEENIFFNGGYELISPTLAFDSEGRAHMAWATGPEFIHGSGLAELHFASENSQGLLELGSLDSNLSGLANGISNPFLSISPAGELAIGFRTGTLFENNSVQVARLEPGSQQWAIEQLDAPSVSDLFCALAYQGDTLHAIVSGHDGWFGTGGAGFYFKKIPDGDWTAPESIYPSREILISQSLSVDENGHVHTMWNRMAGNAIIGSVNYATNSSSDQKNRGLQAGKALVSH